MENRPLVSIICTVYNQVNFIEDCLNSVFLQTYPYIEVILVDNGSNDGSVDLLKIWVNRKKVILPIFLSQNVGLCAAFNKGLEHANGKYIIDLSADDLLLPERIERQVQFFESLPESYGVIFSNANLITQEGTFLRTFYPVDIDKKVMNSVEEEQVFIPILKTHLICTPSMMFRKSLLESLEGYDETLAYEDFDFWVRSSKICLYKFQDEILVEKRIHKQSMSAQMLKKQNSYIDSTIRICEKAFHLCTTHEEFQALSYRLKDVIRKCVWTENRSGIKRVIELHKKVGPLDPMSLILITLARSRFPVNRMYLWLKGIVEVYKK